MTNISNDFQNVDETHIKSIINKLNVDSSKQPMFFGEPLGLQRYDSYRYQSIIGFFKESLQYFWRPEEINLERETQDWSKLTDSEKHIFVKTLSYQILLDSTQSKGIKNIIEHTSNNEIEAFGNWWCAYEQLHSYSYSWIIMNLFSNPEEVFNEILNDKEILKRCTSVTKYYDSLIDEMSKSGNEHDLKKAFYLTLVSVNILEGIRFYVSFACSYSFAERKLMEGNAKIIGLIQRDENLHLGFTQFVLKKLRDEPSEGFQDIVKECEPIVIQMFKDAAQEEIEWAEYLFKDGEMIGLNSEILKKYMMYLTNTRMKTIGLKPIFETTKNPIPWIKNWSDSKSIQVLPQETEITSYIIGSLKNNINSADFSKYKDLL
jgi:ribonucleoside-diphosphate reductase beta chain